MSKRTRLIQGTIDLARVPSILDLAREEVLEELSRLKQPEELPPGWEDLLYETGRDLERERQHAKADAEKPLPAGTVFVDDYPILPEVGP